jgi:hypothetical protein
MKKEDTTPKTIKTVKEMIKNKHLAKLTEGAAFIRHLKKKFEDTSLNIYVDIEYELFLIENPNYK